MNVYIIKSDGGIHVFSTARKAIQHAKDCGYYNELAVYGHHIDEVSLRDTDIKVLIATLNKGYLHSMCGYFSIEQEQVF